MARKTTHYETLPEDEPDADVYSQDAEPAEAAPETNLSPEQQTAAQVDNHKATVVAAVGTMVSSIQAAVTTFKAGGTNAALQTAVKNANVAFYQSVLSSGQTNQQPIGGALDALHALGAL
jgi:hypothetical protein